MTFSSEVITIYNLHIKRSVCFRRHARVKTVSAPRYLDVSLIIFIYISEIPIRRNYIV